MKYNCPQAAEIARQIRQTGGGPATEKLTPHEEKIIAIMGDTSVQGNYCYFVAMIH